MHRRPILRGLITCFISASIFPVGYVNANNSPLAKECVAAARGQAAITRENADRAALTALIAEKQAVWTDEQSTAARRPAVDRKTGKFKVRKIAPRGELKVREVFFAAEQAEPPTAALRQLSPFVTFLKDHPQKTIRIEGYADSRGSESSNLTLSRRRAGTVRDFLIANGISPRQITTRGHGEGISVAANTTRVGQQANRRVDVIVSR